MNEHASKRISACRHCGAEIAVNRHGRGRKRVYCDATCRVNEHRQQRSQRQYTSCDCDRHREAKGWGRRYRSRRS